eukprot:COSAG02_NODE_11613_length_1689_cov_2.084906_2_plen_115_part_01
MFLQYRFTMASAMYTVACVFVQRAPESSQHASQTHFRTHARAKEREREGESVCVRVCVCVCVCVFVCLPSLPLGAPPLVGYLLRRTALHQPCPQVRVKGEGSHACGTAAAACDRK